MLPKLRYRLSTTEPLSPGARVTLSGNAAHYLINVLRLKSGDAIGLFSRRDGEFTARIADTSKRAVTLEIGPQTRLPDVGTGLTVCFVPIKGGRLETIIEKATELGADVLQPIFSTRSVVDKFNRERAEAIAREAAEQCERVSWPEIREPIRLLSLLGDWPQHIPLFYGDESGGGESATCLLTSPFSRGQTSGEVKEWAVLAGPEGGFTTDEFTALGALKQAKGLSLGPRILRADTAIITLCVATLMAWGDWDQRPRAGVNDA